MLVLSHGSTVDARQTQMVAATAIGTIYYTFTILWKQNEPQMEFGQCVVLAVMMADDAADDLSGNGRTGDGPITRRLT
jgi:hypothetical protein